MARPKKAPPRPLRPRPDTARQLARREQNRRAPARSSQPGTGAVATRSDTGTPAPTIPQQRTRVTAPRPARALPPVPPHGRSGRRWGRTRTRDTRQRTLDVLLLAAVAAAIVAWAVVLQQDTSPGQPEPARPAASPPVAVPGPGELIQTRVRGDGTLEVDHWVRSGTPLFSLTLSTPDGQPGGRGLVARHVVVREGGVPVPGRSQVGATPVRYDLNGARRVQVSYELSGALVRSVSAPVRALVTVTSLDLSYAPDRGPKKVMVVGVKVRSLACEGTDTDAVPHPCGTRRDGHWEALLGPAGRHDVVLAQVDLG